MTNTVIVPRITLERAAECEAQINSHADNLRKLLVELYEGEVWTIRGFPNWREYVTATFSRHQSTLYRLLNAGLLEREISPNCESGSIPESQLREIGKLDSPELRQAAWEAAQCEAKEREEKLTAKIVKMAVNAAADLTSEVLEAKGFGALDGKGLDVMRALITERMVETRNRQQEHIASSIDGKYHQERLIINKPFTIVRASEETGNVLLNFADKAVAQRFKRLLENEAKDLRLYANQVKPKEGQA